MVSRSSTDACGNTIRNVQTASTSGGSSEVNANIEIATDGTIDYSKGQPEYSGDALCDPSRDGGIDPTCCK